VTALADHVSALPREATLPRSAQQKLVLSALSALQLAEVPELCELDDKGQRPDLSALLERLFVLLPELSNSVSGAYLNHSQVSRQLQSDS
jgi:hypothetical protein